MPDGSSVDEFLLSTQPADMGYGASSRKVLNKGLTIGDIRYQINGGGLQQVQNTSISFSNVGQFYHVMRERNGDDFWNGLTVSIYWATGRVNTLQYTNPGWKSDGETTISFTPTETYPLINDVIKKEFEGTISSATLSKDTCTLSLVSKSKQDSYKIGDIQSFNGSDASRSLISPIVIGDMTDDNAFVPMILKNAINYKSTGVCSDVALSEAPTPYIYDDENERFHAVVNAQKSTNSNKQIEFYNEDESKSITTSSEFIETIKSGDLSDGPIFYTLTTGEVVGYFSSTDNFIIFTDYTSALEYYITSTSERLRSEGSRDYNNDGYTSNGTETGFLSDADMTIGVAKIKLSLYPLNIREIEPQDDISNPQGNGSVAFRTDTFENNLFNYVNKTSSTFFGDLKNFVKYRTNGPRDTHAEPSYDSSSDSIWLAGHCGGFFSTTSVKKQLASEWYNYNYQNKVRRAITADFERFKFDASVLSFNMKFYGAVYKDWESSSDTLHAFDSTSVGASLYKTKIIMRRNSAEFDFDEDIIHDDVSFSGFTTIDGNFNTIFFQTLEDFYNDSINVEFYGWSAYNPVKTIGDPNLEPSEDPFVDSYDPSDLYLDRDDPSFHGSSRFAIDGMRADIEVKARVESKYWCFKGKTGDSELIDGLNKFSSTYSNTAFTARDSERLGWLLAGAHFGDPVYYRDILSEIADEFRVFITDKNGGSELVSMGLSSDPVYTIDESGVPSPWLDNVSFSETDSTEIYNKIVVRYAKNHMTKRYGRTVSFTADSVTRTEGVTVFENVAEIQNYLAIASATLAKLGISVKTKTIDLEWVRDDETANKIVEWWSKNSWRQRATISAVVSKLKFIDLAIGDLVALDLPQLPEFYQVNYQVTKIVNKSDKRLQIECEEIVPVTPLPPEYLTGLRVLIKDGQNIAPNPASWTSIGSTFSGYDVTFLTTSGLVENTEDKYESTEQFTIALFYNFTAGVPSLNFEALTATPKYWLLNGGISDRNIYTRNPTTYNNLNRDLSNSDYTFLALSINGTTVKSYCNTNSSGDILTSLVEARSETLANQTDIDTLFQKVRCGQGTNFTVTKVAMWNTALSLEILQEWYDLGPTGDPL